MILYIDGGCSNQSQKNQDIRDMVWIITDEDGKELFEGKHLGGSNNIAEFLALYQAVHILPEKGGVIYTDSKNNIAWLHGRIGKKLNNVEWVETIYRDIVGMDKKFDLIWIPRAENKAGWIIEERYGL